MVSGCERAEGSFTHPVAANRWKLFTTDAFGNLLQVDEPNPGTGANFVTTYTYTLLNQLRTATMTRGSVTQTRTWTYDADFRLVSVQLPETGPTSFTYDAQSRIATRTDAKGLRQEFSYDSYNRVTEVRVGPAGSTTLWRRLVYDGGSENGMGRLTRVDYGPFDYYSNTIPKLRESFSYTPGGLLAGRTVAMNTWNASLAGVTARFGYNNEGRLTRINYPRGWNYTDGAWQQDFDLSYEYSLDAQGRPSAMAEKSLGYRIGVAGAGYDFAGRMTSLSAFGVSRAFSYNDRGQLTSETSGYYNSATYTPLTNLTYTFDAAANDGRVKQRVDAISGETVTYLYDKLGRLSSATATGAGVAWSQSFTHDGFGNLTQLTGSGTNLSLTVNDKNQITSGGASYDANGNVISFNGKTLGYDIDNRLASAFYVYIDAMPETAGYGTETYGNSVMGQRIYVERSMSNGWRQRELRMYGPEGGIIGEYIMKPATSHPYEEVFYPVEKLEKRRVYFAGRLVKFGTKAVVTDRLGSMIATRDTGTSQITRYRYYPYGEAIGTQEWDKPQFATYTRDGSSGLDDAMNRQYDRIWGRFTTPDPYQASAGPADPGSWNRYAYVQGDPVNWADEAGLYQHCPQGDGCRMDTDPFYDAANGGPETRIVGQESNTGRGGGGTVSTPREHDLLQAAFDKAAQALQDPDCRGIYGTGGTGLNPSTVLTSIKDGGRYGSITFKNEGPRFGAAETQPKGIPRPSTATGVRFPRVSIKINSYNDQNLYWNDGDVRENTDTLLHELGHALRFLGVSGGQFRHGDNSDENGRFNRNLIDENCLKKIQW